MPVTVLSRKVVKKDETQTLTSMRLKLIACEILYREVCEAVARSVNQIDVQFMPKGLHDIGAEKMHEHLAAAIEEVDTKRYDAILLGYALCSNGIVGLTAKDIPLVVPRAHDCITLFLGSKKRYEEYFHSHDGVYFHTSGWIERGNDLDQFGMQTVEDQIGATMSYEELVEKYGEDNAKFLYDEFQAMRRNYKQITFIEMGIEPDDRFERHAEEEAKQHGWKYEKVQGNLSLIHRLVDGIWDEKDFLVAQPGQKIAPAYDGSIIKIETN